MHRTKLALDADVFALQLLRDQIGQKVYPAHRIDRKTAGILLFSLDEEMDRMVKTMFEDRSMTKTYLSINRGYTPDQGHIDYDLHREDGTAQEAITDFKTLSQNEIPVPFGPHSTSRYSLVESYPQTGRFHQIRKHFAHLRHPIIADRPHGCNKQNKLFKEKWNMDTMMLHASRLQFVHPITEQKINIEASLSSEFERMLDVLELRT